MSVQGFLKPLTLIHTTHGKRFFADLALGYATVV